MPPFPQGSVDTVALAGQTTAHGLYYTLVRWHPGYFSAPHYYSTDLYCMVLSGTWWCNSGADFDPAVCVPVQAGSYVRRVALRPHCDGVIKSHNEPVVIAICGIGPVNFMLSDPSTRLAGGVRAGIRPTDAPARTTRAEARRG